MDLAFINHGRAGFPSGNGDDRGKWRGKVVLHPEKLGLKTDRVTLWGLRSDFSLEPIKTKRTREGITFDLNVDHIYEVLVSDGRKPMWPKKL